MVYTLNFYFNGTPNIEYFRADKIKGTLVNRVREHIALHTSDPDVPFTLSDRQGNVIMTEEDLD